MKYVVTPCILILLLTLFTFAQTSTPTPAVCSDSETETASDAPENTATAKVHLNGARKARHPINLRGIRPRGNM